MEVIVRLQDQALCASITCITGAYAEPEGRVIFDHRRKCRDERYLAAVATVTGRVVQLSVQGCELVATPGPGDLIADDWVRVCPGQTRACTLLLERDELSARRYWSSSP